MAAHKPIQKLFKIGEVAEYSGLSRQTVNYYTVLGILRERERTQSGHRLYDESVFDVIERVRELRKKMTLREIADLLRREAASSRREGKQNGKDA
jgi:DNA-binding transcriptional MerR regulator